MRALLHPTQARVEALACRPRPPPGPQLRNASQRLQLRTAHVPRRSAPLQAVVRLRQRGERDERGEYRRGRAAGRYFASGRNRVIVAFNGLGIGLARQRRGPHLARLALRSPLAHSASPQCAAISES